MNVILLVCDALRASNLGCYGYDKNTSSEIDRIAERGARFSNAFSTINSTDASFTTIFTGKHPISHGLRHHAKQVTAIEKSYTTNLKFLPEILQEHGFATIGIDWLGKWHRRGYDFYGGVQNYIKNNENRGLSANKVKNKRREKKKRIVPSCSALKQYRSKLPQLPSRGSWYYSLPCCARKYIRAFSLFANARLGNSLSGRKKKPILTDSAGLSDLASKYIKQFAGKQDLFLFVHYWDNHIPYTAPRSIVKDFLQRYDYPDEKVSTILRELSGTKAEYLINRTTRGKTPDTIGEIIAYYDASIRYVDSNIGRIYRTLEQTGILNKTMIIITSDHGESLTEHDIFFDHHGLYEPQIRIPLILHYPDTPSGSVYDEFVQHFDLVPTILDLTGITDMNATFDGESLRKLIKGKEWNRDFVFAEELCGQKKRMIRDKRYKYIEALDQEKCVLCQKYHSKGDEFYDLKADPREEKNIIHDPKHIKYKNELARYISTLEKPQEGREVTFEDEEEVNKRLEALGYL